jgi:hypothetical protein
LGEGLSASLVTLTWRDNSPGPDRMITEDGPNPLWMSQLFWNSRNNGCASIV